MLGKLIKNDMKSAARGVSNIYIAALIAVFAMGICLFADVGVGKVLSSVVLIAISIAAIVVTIMATLGDYKKTMFADRGYLTNTLPVKAPSLLFSKWLTSMVWISISYLVIFLCMWLVYYYWTGEDSGAAATMVLQMLPEFGFPSEEILLKTIVLIAVKGVFLLTVFTLEVFFAITLSNVKPFSNLGGIGPIFYFFATYGVMTFCSSGLERIFKSALLIGADGKVSVSADIATIEAIRFSGGASVTLTQIYFQIIVSVVLFVATAELIDRKINIK